MAKIEEKTFKNAGLPYIYCRYVDDIFILTKDIYQVNNIQKRLTNNSCLKFTCQNNNNNELSFLDVWVKLNNENFQTKVYTKETNNDACMNAKSECPDRYKKGVMISYIRRAYTHCNGKLELNAELNRIKQLLVNNGYSNKEINEEIIKLANTNFELINNNNNNNNNRCEQ